MTEVLHDFDNAYPSGSWAFRRGWKLILYALSKKLPFLRRYCKEVYRENYLNAAVMAKLDRLVGVTSRFGINTRVAPSFPQLKSELEALGGVVHSHWHVSQLNAKWDPELPYDMPTSHYHFDQDYAAGKMKAGQGDILCFHVDYPYLLGTYISALYDVRFGTGGSKS